jgi:hypothetical protein
VTRKLRILRAHGIIRKVQGTHRYVLTKRGRAGGEGDPSVPAGHLGATTESMRMKIFEKNEDFGVS